MPMQLLNVDKRMPIRLPKSEYDYSTIVNIFPKSFKERNVTLEPSEYNIPEGTYEKPGLLKVFSASWLRDVSPEQPYIEIPVPSEKVAESIVRDCVMSMPWAQFDANPGVFTVFQDFDVNKEEHKKKLEAAKVQQTNWFKIQVRQADLLWARTNHNPLAISEDMRISAKLLNLVDKEWLSDLAKMDMIRCKACTSLINPQAVICPNCKVILDAVAFGKLGMKIAG